MLFVSFLRLYFLARKPEYLIPEKPCDLGGNFENGWHPSFLGGQDLLEEISLAPAQPKTMVIAGCSSGLGRVTALRMAKRGWHVFATFRKEADRASLIAACRHDRDSDRDVGSPSGKPRVAKVGFERQNSVSIGRARRIESAVMSRY